MAERTFSRDEQALADRLRREAIESRPEFSARLHARVCRALGQLRSESVGSGAQEHSLRTRRLHGWHARAAGWKWIAAAAAACLAGVAIVAWQATRAARGPELAGTELHDSKRERSVGNALRGVPGSATDAAIPLPGTPRSALATANLYEPALGPPGPGVVLYALSDLTDRVSGPIGDWVDSTVAIQQWAYLDHDARLTVEMLADRLPFDVAAAREPPGEGR